jgi:hypothetical protein
MERNARNAIVPDLQLLVELLDRITAGNNEVRENVERLKRLLDKISKTTARVHIDVDYDGREFHWKIPQSNMTAEEWTSRDLRQKRTDGK